MAHPHKFEFAWQIMRFAYGAVVLLAGLDKVLGTNLIVYWPKYISAPAAAVLGDVGISIPAFLFLIGLIEVAVGILAFTRFTMLASYVSVAWLVVIAINLLIIGGYVDIAIRDLLLAVGAYATAHLAQGLGYTISGKRASEAPMLQTHAQTA
jgi:hypothetical protein